MLPTNKVRSPDEALAALGALYRERHAVYGDTNRDFGKVLMANFPDGLAIRTEEEASRLALLMHALDKLARYARQFYQGGHVDSLDDVAVYAQMLQEIDAEAREKSWPVSGQTEIAPGTTAADMGVGPEPRRIFGLAGLLGSGKTTAAKVLVREFSFERVRFAGPIKEMLVVLGLSEEEVDGSLKDSRSTLLGGATPRRAMQTLGTEWGRNMIWQDLWLEAAKRRVAATRRSVVIDDVRFENEAVAIREMGGIVVRIDRLEALVPRRRREHTSEGGGFAVDHVLLNHGTLGEFEETVRGLLRITFEPDGSVA